MKELRKICNSFISNLELLQEYVISINDTNFKDYKFGEEKAHKEELTNILKFILQCVTNEDEKSKYENEVNLKSCIDRLNEIKKIDRDEKKRTILFRSALMSLVVYFEGMIADIFKYLLNKNPDSVINNKQLTFKEIKELGSIENSIEYLIEKEIESITRGDYNTWCNELKKRFSFELKSCEEENDIVNEIVKRRNLYVHNNGYVNNIYLKTVNNKFTEGLKKGQIIDVDIDYIENAIRVLKKVGCGILIELFKKNDKKSEIYWDYFFEVGYDELVKGNYINSTNIFNILCKDKNINSKYLLNAKANLFLSKKLEGKYSDIEEEINSMDISALRDDLKVVFLLIKGDTSKALKLLETTYPQYISKENIYSWPVFKEVIDNRKLKRIVQGNLNYKMKLAHGYKVKKNK